MAEPPHAWTADPDRLEQELFRAQKMETIGQLVSGVAHDVNNPLAAIVAFSELIRRDPRLPDDLQREADLLVHEADRTRRVVQNLLDFARQRPPERHPTALRPLVDSVLELLAYLISANRIAVEVDLPTDLPLVPVDRAQLQQAVLNVTLNAVQAIRERGTGGSIRIRALPTDPGGEATATVRLEVVDDGPGVASEHRERLFEPFFSTKPPGQATGLGLPVAAAIVAAHGGRLWFEAPDAGGAAFAIELPALATEGRENAPQAVDPQPPIVRARPRVLVVDDEPSVRRLLARALERSGCEAVVAENGSQAVELAEAGGFDAILCDHRMAGLTGLDVFEAVVAARPELAGRFILMSGDVHDLDLLDFAERHGIGLLPKPFDLDTIERIVRGVLRRPGPQPRG